MITTQPSRQGLSSAISQVLRDHRAEENPCLACRSNPHSVYRLRVAEEPACRARAYRLAYEVYRASGFVDEHPQQSCTSDYDQRPETFVLLAEDAVGRAVATVTLIFDAPESGEPGLPCDEIFGAETARMRRRNRKLVEVTRLAMASGLDGSKDLLLRLFTEIFLYARRTMSFEDFLIEIHPRHAAFYQRLLGFEIFGNERPCPRVKGAPAVLLRLDLVRSDREALGLDKRPRHEPWQRMFQRMIALQRHPRVMRHAETATLATA